MSELLAAIAAHRLPMIGMIALGPLPGGSRYRDTAARAVLDAALREAEILTGAGFDLLMVQNLGDLPVAQQAAPAQVAWMTRIAAEVRNHSGRPVGLNLLENDAEAMLAIAAAADLDFVRIKVFVGAMVTAAGIEAGQAHAAIRARTAYNADGVAIFADMHDRTGVPIASAGLADDLRTLFAIGGADGVVLTGRSTAQTLEFLQTARAAMGDKPMLVGGGASLANLAELLSVADGAIVSSALKTDDSLFGQLDAAKARGFMRAVRSERLARSPRTTDLTQPDA